MLSKKSKTVNNAFYTSLLLILLLLPIKSMAVIETYQFKQEQGKERYQTLVDELRCPKCQNQNLSGSNSPIAKDLRRELHRMIEAGNNDEQIKAFMVKRYGNFVLYKPPVDKNTIALWAAPAVLFVLAIIFIIYLRRSQTADEACSVLSEHEQLELSRILSQYR